MKQSDSIAALAPALVAAQAELKTIGYDAENPHFHSRFASLAKIIETVRPVLAKHNLCLLQGGAPEAFGMGPGEPTPTFGVETRIIHKSGEWIAAFVEMPLGKRDPQGAGAAMTYGRRYGLSALLSLATDEDDDGQSAMPNKPARARTDAPADHPRPVQRGGHAVGGAVMPFGKNRGKPMSEIATDQLTSAMEWAAEKNENGKFDDFLVTANDILAQRGEIPGGTDDGLF